MGSQRAILATMEKTETLKKLNEMSKESLVFLIEEMQKTNSFLEENNQKLSKELEQAKESLSILQDRLFGRKTEKSDQFPGQYAFNAETGEFLLNEAEVLVDQVGCEEPTIEEATSPRKKRKSSKGKREQDLSALPKETIPAVELTNEELNELFPNGYVRMPDKVSSEVIMEPIQFKVIERHRAVYASRPDDNGNVEFAYGPMPHGKLFGSNSIATSSLVAAIVSSKYRNANPIQRISDVASEHGLHISPQDMSGWCIKAAERYFSPLYELMRQEMVRSSKLIHADESPFKVTEEMSERGSNAKCYMWVYHTDEQYDCHPIFLYEYCSGRGHENPKRFLNGYRGILLTDGYSAYHTLAKQSNETLIVAGCWAHAKRKFVSIQKAVGVQRVKGSIADEANKRIQAIYHMDGKYKHMLPEERQKMRQINVRPLVDAYFGYLKKKSPEIDKSSELGRAINYSLNQEEFLRRFLDNGIIPLDNNDAERSIRTFCVGRANWHVVNSKRGATASAILISMTQTAKANGLKSYEYLRYVMDQMVEFSHSRRQRADARFWGTDFLEKLLPWSGSIPAHCKIKSNDEKSGTP